MDKIDKLNKALTDILNEYKALRNSGISDDILRTYLKAKTKLSDKQVNLFMNSLDDFFSGIVKRYMMDTMEKDDKA